MRDCHIMPFCLLPGLEYPVVIREQSTPSQPLFSQLLHAPLMVWSDPMNEENSSLKLLVY